MEFSALTSILTSLNAAKQIAQSMIDLRDAATFNERVIEFQSRIIDAQSSVFAAQEERAALVKRVSDLEQQMAALKQWEADKQRYELRNLGHQNAFAYVFKPDASSSEPAHAICANCYESGKKAILQFNGQPRIQDARWTCPSCKTAIVAHSRALLPPQTTPPST
jgi:hypothetical protein